MTQQPRSKLMVVACELKFIGPKPEDETAEAKDTMPETPEREPSEV